MKKSDCFAYLPGGGCRVLDLPDVCPVSAGKSCSFYQTPKQLAKSRRKARERLDELSGKSGYLKGQSE